MQKNPQVPITQKLFAAFQSKTSYNVNKIAYSEGLHRMLGKIAHAKISVYS